MQLSKYQVFIEVVKEQSMTGAAKTLNYTQSGISHIVKNLEKELGFQLIIRSNTDFHLTAEGEKVLPVIKNIAEGEEELVQTSSAICGIQEGHLAIGTCCSVSAQWLPSMLKAFMKRYPGVDFDIRDNDYETSESLLEKDFLDCAFLPVPNSSAIEHELLKRDKYYAVIPKGHRWEKEYDAVPITAFEGEPFIIPCEGMNYGVGKMLKDNNVHPVARLHAKDDYGTLAFVQTGIGVTILSELFLKNFDVPVTVKELDPMAYRNLGFCRHKGRKETPVMKIFHRHVLKWVEENEK